MPLVVCYPCGVTMRTQEIGVDTVELFAGKPYRVWHADILYCPKCDVQVVSGFGGKPLSDVTSEHFEKDLGRATFKFDR